MGNRFMANLHVSLESTWKTRISKIATRCQNWEVSIIFLYVQSKSQLTNFSWDPGQMGESQSSSTMSRLNLK